MEIPKYNARYATVRKYALEKYNGNVKRAESYLRGWFMVGKK